MKLKFIKTREGIDDVGASMNLFLKAEAKNKNMITLLCKEAISLEEELQPHNMLKAMFHGEDYTGVVDFLNPLAVEHFIGKEPLPPTKDNRVFISIMYKSEDWDWKKATEVMKKLKSMNETRILVIFYNPFGIECIGSDLQIPYSESILKLSDYVARVEYVKKFTGLPNCS